jgi:hypothetical protein
VVEVSFFLRAHFIGLQHMWISCRILHIGDGGR